MEIRKDAIDTLWRLPLNDTERCGLIVGDQRIGEGPINIKRFIEVRNNSLDPYNHSLMTWHHRSKALRTTSYYLLGYWHTHPHPDDMQPSDFDLFTIKRTPWHIGIVYHVPTAVATVFNNHGIINTIEVEHARNIRRRDTRMARVRRSV